MAMARAVRNPSVPPRRIAALPDFKQSPPASAVTLGRLSKIMPITPMGTAIREISMPLGLVHFSSTRPTGSFNAAISSNPLAMASTRAGFNVKRSMKEDFRSLDLAASKSLALAARIAEAAARTALAMACKAAFFCSGLAPAKIFAAARALGPKSFICCSITASPDHHGALIHRRGLRP